MTRFHAAWPAQPSQSQIRSAPNPNCPYAQPVLPTSGSPDPALRHVAAAASRATGTDTDAFAYSNEGVPSALISLPLRYMHTTVEMCRKEDVENAIQLIYESVLSIKAGQDFRYIK